MLLERMGVSPRRTAKGDVANRLGAALRYRRKFSHALHHVRSSSSAQRRDLTQTGFSKSHILVCRPQHGRGGGTSSSVQSFSSRFGFRKISIMVLALAFPSPGPLSRFLLPFPYGGGHPLLPNLPWFASPHPWCTSPPPHPWFAFPLPGSLSSSLEVDHGGGKANQGGGK